MFRRRNWLHETRKQEHERRITALEEHIQDTEQRFADFQNYVNGRLATISMLAGVDEQIGPVIDDA